MDSMAAKRSGKQREGRNQANTGAEAEALGRIPEYGDAAVVSRRAAARLSGGHVWVYRSDVTALPEGAASLLPVHDARGALLGTALYSPTSEIALRLISREEIASEATWLEVLAQRMRAAIALR